MAPVKERSSIADLFTQFSAVRNQTLALTIPLSAEDMMVQSCPEASPAKWHLAHSTWFFETFLLHEYLPGYKEFHPDFRWLFNSYYNALGEQPEKKLRASFSRPPLSAILEYRKHVDGAMERLLSRELSSSAEQIIVLGLNHEQQHQELIVTDIKHALWSNPLHPAYAEGPLEFPVGEVTPLDWIAHPGGLLEIGYSGAEFCFDNETPQHRVYLEPFELATRTVTCSEYLNFMEDGGYRRPELWLSEGWSKVQAEGWNSPLYWREIDGQWMVFTMRGMLPLSRLASTPVCHISLFEADAYSHWAGKRLPTEEEWEVVASQEEIRERETRKNHEQVSEQISRQLNGVFLESDRFHPAPLGTDQDRQFFGNVWQWTSSAYLGYPGYRPLPGALGEYNGKFMSSQMVLRGGSVVTPASHMRATYRNFFSPGARWQFSGLRLANL